MDKSLIESYIKDILNSKVNEALTPDQASKVKDKYKQIYSGMLKGDKKKLLKYIDPKFNRPNPDAMATGRAINLVKKDEEGNVEESKTEKQRRWACAQVDSKSRPKGLSKAQAKEMCSDTDLSKNENMENTKLTELIKSALKGPVKEKEIKSVLLEDQSKSAVHSLGKDLYDYLTNVVKMKGSLSSPIGGDSINSGQQFTVLINDNKGKFDRVTLRIPVGKDNINKEYIQKNIVDQVKRKYKELETKISQDNSSEDNRAIVDFTLTGPNLFQKVTEGTDLVDKHGYQFTRFSMGEEGPGLQITSQDGNYITIPGSKLGFFASALTDAIRVFDDMSRQIPVDENEPEDDMHDDPGDIRIDHDYYTENLKERILKELRK